MAAKKMTADDVLHVYDTLRAVRHELSKMSRREDVDDLLILVEEDIEFLGAYLEATGG